MERRIDFSRNQRMLCGICAHEWIVDLDWLHRWEQAKERCPCCGTTCEQEDAPRVTVRSNDPTLNDDQVAQLYWYHTSTYPDWPTKDFDPAAAFTPAARKLMGGEERVTAWAARQRTKALHIGTYEAAVHNMLRRMCNQADNDSQFYLYRVHLKPSAVVREGWVPDPGSCFSGDVPLEEVCPSGIDIARYLNYHEDPGGLSLALGRGAIVGVQRVAIPVTGVCDEHWARDATSTLEAASDIPIPATGGLGRFMPPSSPRIDLSNELGAQLAAKLPANLQDQFASAVASFEGEDPKRWSLRTGGLFMLIEKPEYVLSALDRQEVRQL